MKALIETGEFLRQARKRLRYGDLSREPLLLLRVEWKSNVVECDWLMRPGDPWDKYLPPHLAQENQTQQSLRDALQLRELILRCFPAAGSAHLRMFRAEEDQRLELVMTGSVTRSNEILDRVASLVMRAKLCGFSFNLNGSELSGMLPFPL
jgi:hypothetical protein